MVFINLGIDIGLRIVFSIITSYYLIDFARLLMPLKNIDFDNLKDSPAVLVALITGLYWFVRLVFYLIMFFTDLPFKRAERKANKRIRELQIEALEKKKDFIELEEILKDIKKTS